MVPQLSKSTENGLDLPKGQEWKVACQDLGTAIRSKLTVTYPDTADFNGKGTIYRLHYKHEADEV